MSIKKFFGGGSGRKGFSGFPVSSFSGLSDVPPSYTGKANNVLTVNPAENGIAFVLGRGVANGFASLDGSGLLPTSQLPPLAISDYLGSVGSQAAMLLLTGQVGDWCIRSDVGMTFIITANNGHLITDWTQLAYPPTPVHAIGGAQHSADTIADIQTKVSDGSLITTKAGEIDALTAKVTPTTSDELMIEDAADGNKKKKILIGNLPALPSIKYYQSPVLSIYDNTAGTPGAPVVGDRYIAKVTAHGWTVDHIYEWNGATWNDTPAIDGTLTFNAYQGAYYIYNGGAWFNFLLLAPGNHEVLADATDPGSGYLDAKVDNTTIDVSAGHQLEIKNLGITDAKVAVANKDGTAATPSMRTIGAGALQACAGNDSRLSDSRAPTAHAASHEADGSDALTGYDKFYPCVIAAYDPTGGLPAAPAVGDRYISGSTNFGWTVNHIYEWNGATWIDTTPVAKLNILVKGNTAAPHNVNSIVGGAVYTWSGAAWQISKYSGTLLIDANDNKGSGFITDKLWSGDGGVVATDGLGHVTFGARNDGVTIDLIGASPKSIAVKLLSITDAYVAVANKDGTAATPSMRTIGTGALQACAGNDSRLSDSRTPTAHQIGSAAHTADTLANIKSKVSAGTLITSDAAEISTLTEKTTPLGADLLIIEDSAAANAKKKVQISNLMFPRYLFYADQFLSPNNADWTINALAALGSDSVNNAIVTRQFDDGGVAAEQGIGFFMELPAGAIGMTFNIRGRGQAAGGGGVVIRIYTRQISNNAATGAWSAATALTTLAIPANTNWQFFSQNLTFAALGLTAGNIVQFEFTRQGNAGADTLVGNFNLLELKITFN